MSNKKEIGETYNGLTIIKKTDEVRFKNRIYICQCKCGKYIKLQGNHIGRYKSCGNCRGTRGERHTRLFRIWHDMHLRCNYDTNVAYVNYGGRGISICKIWSEDFQVFKQWALSHKYEDTLTIERLDNDGNYEPSNCVWVSWIVQARNRRMPRTNTSGIEGVIFNVGKLAWEARIDVLDKRYAKSLNINKYGCNTALALAIEARLEMVRRRENNSLTRPSDVARGGRENA